MSQYHLSKFDYICVVKISKKLLLDTTENPLSEFKRKLEYYCSYQERCHQEVIQKMYHLEILSKYHDELIVHLITHNFLNEERFARSFARGKFSQKKWGTNRIKNELTMRKIAPSNIKLAMQEIDLDAYEQTFEDLAQKTWDSILERNNQKKRKKFCDFLLRKGWEADRIYEKVIYLENL